MVRQTKYTALLTGDFIRLSITHQGQTSGGKAVAYGCITYRETPVELPITEDIAVYLPVDLVAFQ